MNPLTGDPLIPRKVRAAARKKRQHIFTVGEPALFIHESKGRVTKVPVRIHRVVYNPPDSLTKREGGLLLHFVNYIVQSENGGFMHAMAEKLRPGTVLDRIAEALKQADEEELGR